MIEKDEKWKQIPTEMMSRLGKNLCCFSSDLSVKYFKGLGLIKNTFWRKVLSCWLDNKQKWSTETPAKIALEKQCLWNNSNISYRKQTLFFRDWIDSGFSLVKDILENDNTVMTLKTIARILLLLLLFVSRVGMARHTLTQCSFVVLGTVALTQKNGCKGAYRVIDLSPFLIGRMCVRRTYFGHFDELWFVS